MAEGGSQSDTSHLLEEGQTEIEIIPAPRRCVDWDYVWAEVK